MNIQISGVVHKGQQRGKAMGFPTANIPLKQIVPEGIYISTTTVDEKPYNSLTFIGSAKTFGEDDYKAETYLLDFSGDLYDKEIFINLIKKLRDNQKFESVEKLVEQMNKDKQDAIEYFTNQE